MTRGDPAGVRRLGGALDEVLERMGLAAIVEQHEIFRTWAERMGPEIARVAHPYRVDGETLIVRVANSVWMNELSLRQWELLERLNAGRGHSAVRRIVFRLDPEANGLPEDHEERTADRGRPANTKRFRGGSGWRKRK